MYRVIVLYEQEPDADAYAAHAEVCRTVPNGVFRHGKVFGAPMGDAKHAYYAEWGARRSRTALRPSPTSGPVMSRNSRAGDAANAGPAVRSQLLSASFVC